MVEAATKQVAKEEGKVDGGENVLMTTQLQDMLTQEDFNKALKFCNARKYLPGSFNHHVQTISLYIVGLLKNQK